MSGQCVRLEKVFVYSFPSEAQKKGYRDILARGKYEEDKEGSGIKTGSPYSCWFIQKLLCLEAVCCLLYCSKGQIPPVVLI